MLDNGRVYEVWAQHTEGSFQMFGKEGQNSDTSERLNALRHASDLVKASPPGEVIMIGIHQRSEYT